MNPLKYCYYPRSVTWVELKGISWWRGYCNDCTHYYVCSRTPKDN